MTRPRVVFAMAALAALGCGSAQVANQPASDAGAEASDAEADAAAEPAGDAGPDAAPFPGCPTGDGGFLQPTFPEKRLSVGWDHACGIRDDGTVECWGGGQAGLIAGYTVPPAGTFVRVAAGDSHTCGIRTSGDVECWGQGRSSGNCDLLECGQSIPPPGKFIELAAGYDSTCGLRPDCTIECWGNVGAPGPPAGQFVQMDVWSKVLACAVASDGHIQCWPSLPTFGIGDGGYAPRATVKQVSFGDSCICYVYANHEADCWLYRTAVTSPPHDYVETWSPSGVAAISCGALDACAILDDGTIACNDGAGPSGTFTEVSCGFGFCCAMHTDGTAECFGGGSPGVPPDFPKGP